MLEAFKNDEKESGIKKARQRFVWSVIRFFRPGIFLRNKVSLRLASIALIRSDFKISYRSLARNKIYTLISLCSLTVSITAAAYILMYAKDELSYDKHFRDYERIYRLSMVQTGESEFNSAWTPPAVGYAYKESFPEVESFATLHKFWKSFSVSVNDKEDISLSSVYFANPDCFEIFSLEFLEGSPESALASTDGVVLSQALAKKLFKDESPLGRSIQTTFGMKTVTGILAENKRNTHLQAPEIILSILDYFGHRDILQNWSHDATTYNYIKLKKTVSFDDVRTKLEKAGKFFLSRWHSENKKEGHSDDFLQFQSLEDIHLYSHKEFEIKPNGNPMYLYAFALTGFLLVVIASINYMNLATAKSTERIKEVGVRKTFGTTRDQLIRQFLTESFLLTLMCSIGTFLFLWMLMPWMNSISGKTFLITDVLTPFFISLILGMSFLTGVLGGLYPSLVISGYKSIDALKGNIVERSGNISVRNSLIVLQFGAAMVLVAGTFVVYLQLQFVSTQDLGFTKEQVVAIEINSSEDKSNIPVLTDVLEGLPGVRSVALTAQLPGGDNIKTEAFEVEKINGDFSEQLLQYAFVDENFIGALDLEVTAGRNFNEAAIDPVGEAVVVNELMVKRMGWKDPLGKKIKLPIGKDAQVVGVIKDFHLRSLHDEIQPFIMINYPQWANVLLIRLETSDLPKLLSAVEKSYKKVVGDKVFTFAFLDQHFHQQYVADEQRGKLFACFSGITVFIACIGLLGLLGITLAHRTKEVGIRKILGASISDILVLISREYIKLIVLSIALGIPLSYYITREWLSAFAYQIELSWWMFALPGACILIVTICIVSAHSFKIAFLNANRMLSDD